MNNFRRKQFLKVPINTIDLYHAVSMAENIHDKGYK
jgi:hypothetical protein